MCTEDGWVWLMGELKMGEFGWWVYWRWVSLTDDGWVGRWVFLPIERSGLLHFYLSRSLIHCDFTCWEIWFTMFLPVERSGSLCFYLSRGLVHCAFTCQEVWFSVFYLSRVLVHYVLPVQSSGSLCFTYPEFWFTVFYCPGFWFTVFYLSRVLVYCVLPAGGSDHQ